MLGAYHNVEVDAVKLRYEALLDDRKLGVGLLAERKLAVYTPPTRASIACRDIAAHRPSALDASSLPKVTAGSSSGDRSS